jgi:hypothetical protein
MAEQNKINNISEQLQVNDISFSGNTISSATDLILSTDNMDAILFQNSSNTLFDLTSNGQLTNPYQISFLSYASVTQDNVTGSGGPYVVYFDTTKYDIGGHFDDQYFIAPVTGLYYFSCSCVLNGLSAGMTSLRLNLTTSNQTYNSFTNAYGISTVGSQSSIHANIITQMDAADVCSIEVTVSGGTATADMQGAATLRTFFSGHRIA